MDAHLRTLIDLQAVDGRIAALEAEAARIPREIAAIHAAVGAARAEGARPPSVAIVPTSILRSRTHSPATRSAGPASGGSRAVGSC